MYEFTEGSLETAVFEALGAASMAWDPIPAGVFKSTQAQLIGEAVMYRIADALNEQYSKGVEDGEYKADERYQDGLSEGLAGGYDNGYSDGWDNGYESGIEREGYGE